MYTDPTGGSLLYLGVETTHQLSLHSWPHTTNEKDFVFGFFFFLVFSFLVLVFLEIEKMSFIRTVSDYGYLQLRQRLCGK